VTLKILEFLKTQKLLGNNTDLGASQIIFSWGLISVIREAERKTQSKILFVTDKFWTNEEIDPSLSEYLIDINDSDNTFVNLLNNCKKNINLIIDTQGGEVTANDKMIKSLLTFSRNKNVYTYVPCQAYSAGSMLSLIGKKIHIGKCAVLTPTDPQICTEIPDTNSNCYSPNIIKKAHKITSNPTFIDNIVLQEAIKYDEENISNTKNILERYKYNKKTMDKIVEEMCSGKYTHGKPFDYDDLKKMGLNVVNTIPKYVQDIVDELYDYKKNF
jgi:membrane-bound ClpP family serine protease